MFVVLTKCNTHNTGLINKAIESFTESCNFLPPFPVHQTFLITLLPTDYYVLSDKRERERYNSCFVDTWRVISG